MALEVTFCNNIYMVMKHLIPLVGVKILILFHMLFFSTEPHQSQKYKFDMETTLKRTYPCSVIINSSGIQLISVSFLFHRKNLRYWDMSIVTASLVLLTKQDTFKYNVLLELTKKLHEKKH